MVVMARVPRPERPDLVFEEEDLPYEEEIMRNQFSVKCWLRYIEFKQGAPKPRLNQLYERALKLLPLLCFISLDFPLLSLPILQLLSYYPMYLVWRKITLATGHGMSHFF
uniref:Pre-mRNA-splicing factor Syf1-like N-terminal HAT-repeats domain-containing protein n=1 Tax=Peromyscus maniculatus bairdii TaxID=230844 RepID=A0A8C8TN46_PERMB